MVDKEEIDWNKLKNVTIILFTIRGMVELLE